MNNQMFAVFNGTVLLSRKEKATGRLIPACFWVAHEANQTRLDFNSLIPGNNAVVVEIYPTFKPVKAKVKRK